MSKNPLKIKIAYLYPDILQGTCDRANIEVLYKRTKWRDIDAEVNEIRAYDRIISPSKYDLYYIGGSNTEAMNFCLKHLKTNQDEIKIATMAKVPLLAVNCGYQLIGNSFQLYNKPKTTGIGLLNVESITSKKHYYGYIKGNCNFLKNKTIVGFEDRKTNTYILNGVEPFLTYKNFFKKSNKTEGAKKDNIIGTYITSPLLAQNPNLCDYLIALALRTKYKCKIPITQLCDDVEWYSHYYIQNLVK